MADTAPKKVPTFWRVHTRCILHRADRTTHVYEAGDEVPGDSPDAREPYFVQHASLLEGEANPNASSAELRRLEREREDRLAAVPQMDTRDADAAEASKHTVEAKSKIEAELKAPAVKGPAKK